MGEKIGNKGFLKGFLEILDIFFSLSSTTSAVDRIGKLFTTVDLAFDLYDRFDWSSDECRRRMWCHFNGGNSDEKRTFMPDWVKKSNYW